MRPNEISVIINGQDKSSPAFRSVNNRIKNLGDRTQRLGQSLKGLSIAGAAVSGSLALAGRSFVKAFIVQERAVAGVSQAVKRLGDESVFSSKQFQNMASELQGLTKFGDEEILRGVTEQLLTFRSLSTGDKGVFKRAQMAALDLAETLGRGLTETSIQLGKALDDPIKGMTALSRSGITFSDAQKKLVQQMVETGEIAEAQGFILSIIEQNYGGAARAARDTFGGALKALSNTIGDLKEELGGIIAQFIKRFLPTIEKVVSWFQNLDDATKEQIVKWGGIALAIGGVAASLSPILLILGKLLAFGKVGLILGGIATAIGVVGAALTAMGFDWKQLGDVISNIWNNWLKPVWDGFFKQLIEVFAPALKTVLMQLKSSFETLLAEVQKMPPWMQKALGYVALAGPIILLTALATIILGVAKAIQLLVSFFSGLATAINKVVSLVNKLKEAFKGFNPINSLSQLTGNITSGFSIPRFASGGVSKGGLALVGERGPELVNLNKGDRVYSNEQSQKMAGITINGDIYINDQPTGEWFKSMLNEDTALRKLGVPT